MKFTILAAAMFLASTSTFAATNLITNPTFTPSATQPKAFYLKSITDWMSTGTKSVGWDSTDAQGGLWLSQTRSISTGSASNLGWTTAKAQSLTVIPATCHQQTVTAQFYFRGLDPYVPTQSGLEVNYGSSVAKVKWQPSNSLQTLTFTTSEPAGTVMATLTTIMGLKQVSGIRAGIEVVDFQVTCP